MLHQHLAHFIGRKKNLQKIWKDAIGSINKQQTKVTY